MKPKSILDANEMFTMSLALVQARGDEHGLLWLNDHFVITDDVPLLGKNDEANNLTISIGGRTVLRAIYNDHDWPPLFLDYFPDHKWRWAIRRAHAELELEKRNERALA